MLHTHLIGNSLTHNYQCMHEHESILFIFVSFPGTGLEFSVVEIVNCSSGQTRFEQTQLVERNVNYDFNFQQANHLSKEIIVKPVRCT